MELRQRKSPAASPREGTSSRAFPSCEEFPSPPIMTAGDGITNRTSLLMEENRQLRQELERLHSLLQQTNVPDDNYSTPRKEVSDQTQTSSTYYSSLVLPSFRSSLIWRKLGSNSSNEEFVSLDTVSPGLHHRHTHATSTSDDAGDMALVLNSATPRRRGHISPLKSKLSHLVQTETSDDEPINDLEASVPLYNNLEHEALLVGGTSNISDNIAAHSWDDVGTIGSSTYSFSRMVLDRSGWLVGLLILQSLSSFIIQTNEALLQKHLVIIRFLTMLVGAGGNAGNQASVRVIRGLAVGTIKSHNVKLLLLNEFTVGLCLAIVLGIAGWFRAAVFSTPFLETIAITTSLFVIVMLSVVLGAILPLGMKLVGIDPAHSSTTIQVLMDILGVTITVYVSGIVLESKLTTWITQT